MALSTQVMEVFAAHGVLSRAAPDYLPRQGQIDMALAVTHALEQGEALVVEAGTGVGKTFSYLVPTLLSGERVLISTATKTLQDQLFSRDLPQLVQTLGLPLRVALLKGRASYLCTQRLESARHNALPGDRFVLATMAKIERWAQTTRSGDLAELSGLDERSAVIPLVTSTRDNCLGSPCPHFQNCHVNLARREAMAADVVVINHHLFFADLAVRESGVAELLPSVRVVVFDEAHQLNETGVQFLGAQISTAQLLDYARDLLGVGLQLGRGLVDWHTVAGNIEHAARELRLVVGRVAAGARLGWSEPTPDGVSPHAWNDAMQNLAQVCGAAMQALDTVQELAPDFVRLRDRAALLVQRLHQFTQACQPDAVRWVEAGMQLRLIESPLDIAQAVQTRLLGTGADADAQPQRGKTWIFTSATLGTDDALRWFTEPCGLTQVRTLRVTSPFDYAVQAAVYVPPNLPRPNDPQHSAQVASLVADGAISLGGRTLVLTTSLRALSTIGEILQARFEGAAQIQVLVQGQSTKRQLMQRFREGNANGAPGCILVASASFWEGVDVPGDALQLVVIDKLPFPPPNDPLVQARAQRLERAGRSAFNDYFLPEAAVALKQGAGRLIRRESDRGVLVVCDNRLTDMGYGRRLMAALPPMRRLKTSQEFAQALTQITKFSTTDFAPA